MPPDSSSFLKDMLGEVESPAKGFSKDQDASFRGMGALLIPSPPLPLTQWGSTPKPC